MGNLPGRQDPNAVIRSKEIDAKLQAEQKQVKRTIKMLLLGPSNSGKSTVLKQMRILHMDGFNEEEKEQFRLALYGNIVQSVYHLVKAVDKMGLDYENPDRIYDANLLSKIVAIEHDREPLTAEVADAICALWNDKAIKAAYQSSIEFNILESTEYFLSQFDRIRDPNYVPSYQDILYSRIRTRGVQEIHFVLNSLQFRVIDVGGEKSERRKWIHQFENVNAIIFIVAMNEYDKVMAEDTTTNRIRDALQLFEDISNNQWFRKTSMILFLNKSDLFQEKLRTTPITKAFPKYTGQPDSFDEAVNFIRRQFEKRRRAEYGAIYTHVTCATDTDQIKFVLKASMDMILVQNLKSAGVT